MTPKTIDIPTAEMELAGVEAGTRVQLVRIQAGPALNERLASMGLVPRVIFQVLRNEGHSRLIVEVKGTRIILGRGMSNQVYVRIVK